MTTLPARAAYAIAAVVGMVPASIGAALRRRLEPRPR
jgi:hypothetical protein